MYDLFKGYDEAVGDLPNAVIIYRNLDKSTTKNVDARAVSFSLNDTKVESRSKTPLNLSQGNEKPLNDSKSSNVATSQENGTKFDSTSIESPGRCGNFSESVV